MMLFRPGGAQLYIPGAEVLQPRAVTSSNQYGVDAALIKSAVGIYYIDVDLSQGGVWHYRFYSTGSGQAAGDDQTLVARASRFS